MTQRDGLLLLLSLRDSGLALNVEHLRAGIAQLKPLLSDAEAEGDLMVLLDALEAGGLLLSDGDGAAAWRRFTVSSAGLREAGRLAERLTPAERRVFVALARYKREILTRDEPSGRALTARTDVC